MTSTEIHNNVEQIIADFSKEEFIFDLLLAYGVSKTSITGLKKGDFNLSKNEGELLYKKKVFFKIEKADQLLSTVKHVAKDEIYFDKIHALRLLPITKLWLPPL